MPVTNKSESSIHFTNGSDGKTVSPTTDASEFEKFQLMKEHMNHKRVKEAYELVAKIKSFHLDDIKNFQCLKTAKTVFETFETNYGVDCNEDFFVKFIECLRCMINLHFLSKNCSEIEEVLFQYNLLDGLVLKAVEYKSAKNWWSNFLHFVEIDLLSFCADLLILTIKKGRAVEWKKYVRLALYCYANCFKFDFRKSSKDVPWRKTALFDMIQAQQMFLDLKSIHQTDWNKCLEYLNSSQIIKELHQTLLPMKVGSKSFLLTRLKPLSASHVIALYDDVINEYYYEIFRSSDDSQCFEYTIWYLMNFWDADRSLLTNKDGLDVLYKTLNFVSSDLTSNDMHTLCQLDLKIFLHLCVHFAYLRNEKSPSKLRRFSFHTSELVANPWQKKFWNSCHTLINSNGNIDCRMTVSEGLNVLRLKNKNVPPAQMLFGVASMLDNLANEKKECATNVIDGIAEYASIYWRYLYEKFSGGRDTPPKFDSPFYVNCSPLTDAQKRKISDAASGSSTTLFNKSSFDASVLNSSSNAATPAFDKQTFSSPFVAKAPQPQMSSSPVGIASSVLSHPSKLETTLLESHETILKTVMEQNLLLTEHCRELTEQLQLLTLTNKDLIGQMNEIRKESIELMASKLEAQKQQQAQQQQQNQQPPSSYSAQSNTSSASVIQQGFNSNPPNYMPNQMYYPSAYQQQQQQQPPYQLQHNQYYPSVQQQQQQQPQYFVPPNQQNYYSGVPPVFGQNVANDSPLSNNTSFAGTDNNLTLLGYLTAQAWQNQCLQQQQQQQPPASQTLSRYDENLHQPDQHASCNFPVMTSTTTATSTFGKPTAAFEFKPTTATGSIASTAVVVTTATVAPSTTASTTVASTGFGGFGFGFNNTTTTATSTGLAKPASFDFKIGSVVTTTAATATTTTTTATSKPPTGFTGFGFTSTPTTTIAAATTVPTTTTAIKSTTSVTPVKPPVFGTAQTLAPSFGAVDSKTKSTPSLSFADIAKQTSPVVVSTSGNDVLASKLTFAGAGQPVFGSLNKSSPGDRRNVSESHEDDEGGHEPFEPTVDFKPLIPLPALVEVKTGEENEQILFQERAKLYRFDNDTKEFKERGLGELKVLHNATNDRYRILMRREQVLKLCANHYLTPETNLLPMSKLEQAFTWHCKDYSEGELRDEILAAKFKTVDIAKRFKRVVEECVAKLSDKKPVTTTTDSEKSETTTASAFGLPPPPAGSWTCQDCYVLNDAKRTCCICCSSLPPKSASSVIDGNLPKQQQSQQSPVIGALASSTTSTSSTLGGAKPTITFGFKSTVDVATPTATTTTSSVAANNPVSSTGFGSFGFNKTTTASSDISNLSSFVFKLGGESKVSTTPATATTPSVFTGFGLVSTQTPTVTSSITTTTPTTAATDISAAKPPAFGFKTDGPIFGTFDSKTNSAPLSFAQIAKQADPVVSSSSKDATASKPSFAGAGQPVFGFLNKSSPGDQSKRSVSESHEDDEGGHEPFEPTVDFKPLIPLPALVEVKTGEENEEVLFQERAKLFRFNNDTKEFKERGVGELKVLHNTATDRYRILMRREQVLKLCANHYLTPETNFLPMSKAEQAFTWYCQDYSDGELQDEMLAAKFKNVDVAKRFKTVVDQCVAKLKQAPPTTGNANVFVKSSTTTAPASGIAVAPVGSWNCHVCYVRNNPDKSSCAACATPRVGLSSAGSAFGDRKLSGEKSIPATTASDTTVRSPVTFKFALPPAVAVSTATKNAAPELEVTFEAHANQSQKSLAEKYMLPSNFYLYENSPPCSGCVGCKSDEDLDLIFKQLDRRASSGASESYQGEDTGDDVSSEEAKLLFSKSATLLTKEGGKWVPVGLGEICIVYDDDVDAYRLKFMNTDSAVVLMDHLIALPCDLSCAVGKKGQFTAEWTAPDWAANPSTPVKKTFQLKFSSSMSLKEFSDLFKQGKEIAQKNSIYYNEFTYDGAQSPEQAKVLEGLAKKMESYAPKKSAGSKDEKDTE